VLCSPGSAIQTVAAPQAPSDAESAQLKVCVGAAEAQEQVASVLWPTPLSSSLTSLPVCAVMSLTSGRALVA